MRGKMIYLAILGVLALALVAAGCGGGGSNGGGNASPAPAEGNSSGGSGNPEAGKAVYSNCSACHGAKGEGGVGLPFIAKDGKPSVDQRLSEEDHIKTVTEGRPDKGMPAWKGTLTDQQIRDVVAYERQVLAKGQQ